MRACTLDEEAFEQSLARRITGGRIMVCQRCGSEVIDGKCVDETCPFSDHDQSCKAGWSGHPEMDPHPRDDDRPMPCTCKKVK